MGLAGWTDMLGGGTGNGDGTGNGNGDGTASALRISIIQDTGSAMNPYVTNNARWDWLVDLVHGTASAGAII